MLISTIARRYAEALYEAAKDAGLTREIGEQLEQLLRVLKTDRELDLAFRSPALTAGRRRQLLEECFQGELHPFVLNLQVVGIVFLSDSTKLTRILIECLADIVPQVVRGNGSIVAEHHFVVKEIPHGVTCQKLKNATA